CVRGVPEPRDALADVSGAISKSIVEIDEGDSQPFGKQSTDRRFARTSRTNQRDRQPTVTLPESQENGRRDVGESGPGSTETSGSLGAIIDTEPLHALHRRATRSARRALVQSIRSASAG